ncbi:MAG: poly-gamma-glutamate hydrolase family protein [Cyanobacteria bacterium SZAS LIN-2]|nr:poly-gamma-glutamate hydrolase family protein [Cyanobacteria bacterium SZAS LIN-2]
MAVTKGQLMKHNTDFYDNLEQLNQHLVRDKHFRLRIFDQRSPVTIISPHGGFIEAGTSYLAQAVAGSKHNLFDFQGLRQRRAYELHVTSTKFRHPFLDNLLSRSQIAVSIHSMGTENDGTILVGGLNTEVKQRIVKALLAEGFPVTTNARRYRGVHPQNVVNLAQQKGVQIELTNKVITRMFQPRTPRFAVDHTPLQLTDYGKRFVLAVQRAVENQS